MQNTNKHDISINSKHQASTTLNFDQSVDFVSEAPVPYQQERHSHHPQIKNNTYFTKISQTYHTNRGSITHH